MISTPTTPRAGCWPPRAAVSSSPSTTASRPSTPSRRRSTTRWSRTGGCTQHADELGFEPGQVGVMGDSAGGNLAAVVALEARAGLADGVPAPIAQVLVYPVVDADFEIRVARVAERRLPPHPGSSWSSTATRTSPRSPTGVPEGLAPAGDGPLGSRPGPRGHRRVRPAPRRRVELRSRTPVRRGSRSSTAATTTRSTGSWGWGSIRCRWPSRPRSPKPRVG